MKEQLASQPDWAIRKLIRTLKQGTGQFMVPTAGSSGFTGIVRCPAREVLTPEECAEYPLGPQMPVGAVIKFVTKSDAENEVLCTRLGQAFGLHVPVIQPASPEASALFVSPMREVKAAFSPAPFNMLAMNLIRGTNLIDLCKSKKVLQFSQPQWNDLFYEFGKTAAFDLCIGNYDRFVRFTFDDSTQEYELERCGANLGNAMVQFTPERGENIQGTHMIDCTSLAKEPKPPEADDSPDLLFGLFEEDEHAPSADPQPLPPISPVTPPSTPRKPPISNHLHRFFTTTVENYISGGTELPESIRVSIESALKQSLIEYGSLDDTDPRMAALSEKLSLAMDSLNRGIRDGLKHLVSDDFRATPVLQEILSKDLELSRLLQKNLDWVRNRSGLHEPPPSPRSPSGRRISMHEQMHGFL